MADTATTDNLSPRQYKALGALLAAPSVRQAALDASIPEKTLYNWLRDPGFADAYRAARREATQQAIARAQSATADMVAVLVKIADKETARDADRISAASKVIDIAIKSIELDDILQRLDALEGRYGQGH